MIEINNLTFSYEDAEDNVGSLVLNGVNLTVNDGEFVAVLGRNGSGKSTMAKHINAILLPMGGKVYVDGMDTSDEDKVWDIRQNAAMVFQNPDNVIDVDSRADPLIPCPAPSGRCQPGGHGSYSVFTGYSSVPLFHNLSS